MRLLCMIKRLSWHRQSAHRVDIDAGRAGTGLDQAQIGHEYGRPFVCHGSGNRGTDPVICPRNEHNPIYQSCLLHDYVSASLTN